MDGCLSPSQEEFWIELQRGMSKEFELPPRRDEDEVMITESTPAVPGQAISNDMGAAAASVRSRRASQVNASLHCRNNIIKKPVRPRKLQLGNVPTNLNSSTRSDLSQSMTDGSQIYEANNISKSNRLSSVQPKKLQLGNVPINLNRSTRSDFSQSLTDGSQIYEATNNILHSNRLSSVKPKKLQLGNVPINLNRSTRSDSSQSLTDGSQIYAANNVLNTNRLSSVQPKNPVLTKSKRPWINADVIDLTKDEDLSTVYPRRSGLISNLPSSASSSRFPNQPLSYNSNTHLANRNQPVMGDQYSSGFRDLVSSSSLRSMSNSRKSVNTSLLSEPFLSDSKNKNKQPLGLIPNAYGTNNFLPVKQEDVSYPSSSCLLPNSANPRDFFQAPNLPGTKQNPMSSAVGSNNFAPPAYQQNNELRTGSSSANRFNVMNIKNEPYDDVFNYGNREHIPSNTAVRNAESSQQQIQQISRDEYIKNNGLSLAESSRRQSMIPNNQPSMSNRSSAYGFNLKSIKSEPYDHSSNNTAVRNAKSSQQQIQQISRDEYIKNNGLSLAKSSRRQSMIPNNQPSMANRSSAYGFNLKSIKSEPYDHSSNTAVRNAESSQQPIQLISRDEYIKNNGMSLAKSSRRQSMIPNNQPSMDNQSSAYGFNLKRIKSEPYDHMFHYGNEGNMASSISTVGRTSSLPYTKGSRSQNVALNNVPMANRSNNAYGFNVKSIKSEPYDHMFHYGNQGNMAASSSTVGRTGGLPYAENSSRSENMVFNSEPMPNNSNANGFNVNYGNQGQMSSSSEPMASHSNAYGFNLNYGNPGQMSSSEPMASQSNAYGFNESYGNQGQMSSSSEPMASHSNAYGFNLNYGNQGQMSSSETMTSQSNAYDFNMSYGNQGQMSSSEPMVGQSNAYGFNVNYGNQGQMSSSELMDSNSNAYGFNVNYGNQGQMSSRLEARSTGLPEVGEYSRNSNMVANSTIGSMINPLQEVIECANNPRRNRSYLNKGKNACDNYVDLTLDSP